MAANMTGKRAEGTTVAGAAQKRGRTHGRQIGFSGLLAALMVALLLGGVAMHNRQASHPTAPAIPRAVTSQQTRFIENNATNLPNAVAAESTPVVPSARQRLLDVNTAWLPAVGAVEAAPSAPTSSQRRLLEVNTTMMADETAPQRAGGTGCNDEMLCPWLYSRR